MANTVKKVALFTKEVLARIEGDSDKEIASKNARFALSIADSQIALLKGKLVDSELNVETAEEKLKDITYPTKIIKDRNKYWADVVSATKDLDEAKEELQDVKDSIEFAENFVRSNF